jgi:hypothetical protein
MLIHLLSCPNFSQEKVTLFCNYGNDQVDTFCPSLWYSKTWLILHSTIQNFMTFQILV